MRRSRRILKVDFTDLLANVMVRKVKNSFTLTYTARKKLHVAFL